jgi:hypothetical protein
MTALFFAQKGVYYLSDGMGYEFIIRLCSGVILMLVFIRLVWVAERSELKSFPVIGKYV